jgi:hypothetical protein
MDSNPFPPQGEATIYQKLGAFVHKFEYVFRTVVIKPPRAQSSQRIDFKAFLCALGVLCGEILRHHIYERMYLVPIY